MNRIQPKSLTGLDDPRHFLDSVTEDLANKFAGIFAAETVER